MASSSFNSRFPDVQSIQSIGSIDSSFEYFSKSFEDHFQNLIEQNAPFEDFQHSVQDHLNVIELFKRKVVNVTGKPDHEYVLKLNTALAEGKKKYLEHVIQKAHGDIQKQFEAWQQARPWQPAAQPLNDYAPLIQEDLGHAHTLNGLVVQASQVEALYRQIYTSQPKKSSSSLFGKLNRFMETSALDRRIEEQMVRLTQAKADLGAFYSENPSRQFNKAFQQIRADHASLQAEAARLGKVETYRSSLVDQADQLSRKYSSLSRALDKISGDPDLASKISSLKITLMQETSGVLDFITYLTAYATIKGHIDAGRVDLAADSDLTSFKQCSPLASPVLRAQLYHTLTLPLQRTVRKFLEAPLADNLANETLPAYLSQIRQFAAHDPKFNFPEVERAHVLLQTLQAFRNTELNLSHQQFGNISNDDIQLIAHNPHAIARLEQILLAQLADPIDLPALSQLLQRFPALKTPAVDERMNPILEPNRPASPSLPSTTVNDVQSSSSADASSSADEADFPPPIHREDSGLLLPQPSPRRQTFFEWFMSLSFIRFLLQCLNPAPVHAIR